MRVHAVPDDALGNTSYVVDLGDGTGAVVDPRRDVEEYLDLASRLGLRIVAAVETHLHADFVTGAPELAEAASAEVVTPEVGSVEFGHRGVVGEQEIALSRTTTLRVLATPGHTPEHVAYLMLDDGDPVGVFSGGSLIAGGAARTDLVAPELTEDLARDQFRSLRRLAELPDAAELWPTHGGGSFCSTFPAASGATTIGDQRATNPLLALAVSGEGGEDGGEDGFVRRLLSGYGSFPPYFLSLREVNRRGPRLVRDLAAPSPLSPTDAASLVAGGAWLIDARPEDEWATAHPAGAVSIALRPAFASWLGWVVPFGAPVILIVDEERVPEALTLARRIGYDGVTGWLDGGVEAWRRAGLPVDTVETVDGDEAGRRAEAGWSLVDVRRRAELEASRVPGALHLELGDISAGKTPGVDPVVVFCGHGERSATAASLLSRQGITVANLAGGLPAWEAAGLPVRR